MDISPISAVRATSSQVVPRALSQRALDILVVEIQGTTTRPQLEALGRRIRGFTAASLSDPAHQARLEQLLLAMRIRRDQLKLG